MKIVSEDRRLADATRFCVGQRGAAIATEDVQRRHRLRVGRTGARGQGFQSLDNKRERFRGKLYQSCMGRGAASMHTTSTKEEEDRSGDSTGCLIFAIISPHL